MKLHELPFNTWFVLNRTEERFKKVGYLNGRRDYLYCMPPKDSVWPHWACLHHLCGVTPVGEGR